MLRMISVCIPCYEQQGMGKIYLKHSLEILKNQTFKDFDIVITDDSTNDDIKNLVVEFPTLDIKYYKNEVRLGASGNTNKAMSLATGELVKILFMDDYLYSDTSLEEIIKNFKGNWLVTACEHSHNGVSCYRPFYPYYQHDIYKGENTLSSPSVLTVRNSTKLYFDESLAWLMDCDYYKRCYEKFGLPTVLNTINVVNRTTPYQNTNVLSNESKEAEVKLLIEKYGNK